MPLHLSELKEQNNDFCLYEYVQPYTKNLVVERVNEPSGLITCKWNSFPSILTLTMNMIYQPVFVIGCCVADT